MSPHNQKFDIGTSPLIPYRKKIIRKFLEKFLATLCFGAGNTLVSVNSFSGVGHGLTCDVFVFSFYFSFPFILLLYFCLLIVLLFYHFFSFLVTYIFFLFLLLVSLTRTSYEIFVDILRDLKY